VRFLRARKYNVSKAFSMFSECERWRKDIKLDDLVKSWNFEENPQVTELYPRYYHKTDKVSSLRSNFECRMEGLSTLSDWAKLMSMPCSR
jgi:hypothetical protein